MSDEVRDEVEERPDSEDDCSLSEEGAAVRPPVLVRAGRPGEESEEVEEEHAGDHRQVDEQRVRLE